MAFGKTDEQKAAKAAERAAAEHAASPIGRAEAAKTNGDRFFEVEIQQSTLKGETTFAGNLSRRDSRGGSTDVLGQIELIGWRLEHASHVFIMTGQDSRDKFLASGQQVAVKGEIVGIYLFRNTDA